MLACWLSEERARLDTEATPPICVALISGLVGFGAVVAGHKLGLEYAGRLLAMTFILVVIGADGRAGELGSASQRSLLLHSFRGTLSDCISIGNEHVTQLQSYSLSAKPLFCSNRRHRSYSSVLKRS